MLRQPHEAESARSRPANTALVVGGGVAGARAALDLAALGHRVYLLEKSPRLGGLTSRLHRMYPTCFCCKVHPLLAEVERHPGVEVVCGATLSALEGEPGRFRAQVESAPAFVDAERCTACGQCAAACPHGAIFRGDPRSVPAAFRLDEARCVRSNGEDCALCAAACPEQAIDLAAKATTRSLKVGAVVLATGFEQADPRVYDTFGYGDIPGVVTSLEFEQLLSPFGPTAGRLLRPDGAPARKIAWLQCVGSREQRRECRPYCSAVCCMYALKQARCALSADPEAAGSIFYIDLRAYPRGGEDYLAKVQGEVGERLSLVRARIHGAEHSGNGVRLRYMNEAGQRRSEDYDLAVLSLGLGTGAAAREMAYQLGVQTKEGFAYTSALFPTATTRDGVYACGGFHGPLDVHDSLITASAAALAASAHLARAPRTKPTPLLPTTDDTPRCGVFICRCGGDVSRTVDVAGVEAEAATLPGVAHAQVCESLCRANDQEALIAAVRGQSLTRLVVAGCSERVQGGLIRELARRAGLSPYLLQQVNLREHCGLPHENEPAAATQQAKDMVRMAVARVNTARQWAPEQAKLRQSVLVIGTRLSGLSAAARFLGRGLTVHLLQPVHEQSLRAVTGEGDNVADYLRSLRRSMEAAGVGILRGRLAALEGPAGDMTATIEEATIEEGRKQRRVNVGAVVVATATEELRPDAYLLGQDARVLTLGDLDADLTDRSPRVREVRQAAFIQCVGSRTPENPRCSRTCCARALRSALRLKEISPQAEVWVLYRDLRAYGMYELLYRQAREAGINFVRIEEEPRLTSRREEERDVLELRATDALLGRPLLLEPDLLVLSAATLPSPANIDLAATLKVPLAADGFFAESARKMRPVETDRAGVFICGAATGPAMPRELIASAEAAAAKAAALLAPRQVELWPVRSEVDVANCDGCGYCIDPCPFGALKLIEFTQAGEVKKLAEVNAAVCAGCGVCQATCPKKGINVRGYDLDSLTAAVEAAVTRP